MKKQVFKSLKVDTGWIKDNDYDLDNPLEIKANAIIALKLRRYMESRGLTQKELADKLSVSPQFVSKLLSGKSNLGIGTALKYGELLGITLIEMPVLEDSQATQKVAIEIETTFLPFIKQTNPLPSYIIMPAMPSVRLNTKRDKYCSIKSS